jgi:hypothetical protein
MPHDFPPYSTVHSFYRRARLSGLWEKALRTCIQLGVMKRRVDGYNMTFPQFFAFQAS